MSMDNKAIIRRFYEGIWNERNLAVVDELVAPSHALLVPSFSGSATGPEAYKSQIHMYLKAYPDLQFTIEDLIAEGDRVACCWTISGTHQGEFMGVPATGKRVSWDGVTIHQITNGKIMDSNVTMDTWGLMQQFGVVGQPHKASAP